MSAPEPLWSVAQLAEHLGVCERTVREHANSSDPAAHWPNLRIGRQIKFTPQHVQQIYALTADTRAEQAAGGPLPANVALIRQGLARVARANRPKAQSQRAATA